MHRKDLALLVGLIWGVGSAVWAQSSDGTAMGTLAAQMSPGTWAELNTSGIEVALGQTGGATGSLLPYTDEGIWNPATKEFFFAGGDHNSQQRFVRYAASTNAWTIEPRPPWMPSGVVQDHAYDYQAIDPGRQLYYYAQHRYHIPTRTWQNDLPTAGLPGFGRAAFAQEYFPGLGMVIIGNYGGTSAIYLLRDGAASWQVLASNLITGIIHLVAEYDPVHQVMVLGGGDNDGSPYFNQLYRLERSGAVTRLKPAPVNKITQNQSVLTVDPVSGDFLLVDSGRTFWRWNAVTDTWTQLSSNIPLFIDPYNYNNNAAGLIIAAPVPTYAITMFVQFTGSYTHKVFLYKHVGAAAPDTTPPAAPTALRVE
jgi:hypothetical protein